MTARDRYVVALLRRAARGVRAAPRTAVPAARRRAHARQLVRADYNDVIKHRCNMHVDKVVAPSHSAQVKMNHANCEETTLARRPARLCQRATDARARSVVPRVTTHRALRPWLTPRWDGPERVQLRLRRTALRSFTSRVGLTPCEHRGPRGASSCTACTSGNNAYTGRRACVRQGSGHLDLP